MTRCAAILLAVTGLATASSRPAQGQLVPIGEEFVVNTETAGYQRWPVVAIRDDGAFLVVWQNGSYPSDDIQAQRFSRTGRPIGSAFLVSDPATYTGRPKVAMAPHGDFVVTWGGARGVSARRFDASGRPQGSWFRVADNGYYGHDVAKGANGNFVVAWATYFRDAFVRLYDGDGVALGDETPLDPEPRRLANYDPAVAMGPGGDFVATWVVEDNRPPFEQDLFGQHFDAQGSPLAAEFQVNTFTPSSQGFSSSVAMATDGSFVVVWNSQGQDGSEGGLFGQRYDARGERSGAEFQVNTHTERSQYGAAVAMGKGGDFLVAWNSGHEGSGDGVFVQRFDRDGQRVGGEVKVSGREPVGMPPSAALAADGTLVIAWASRAGPDDTDVRARRFRVGVPADGEGGDGDADGVPAGLDNCPTIANPDQADAQGDGHGDACVSPDVFIPASANLGVNPVIGRGTTIQAGVTIGDDAVIGEHVRLQRQITVNDRLRADDFVTIGRLSILGSDVSLGFATRLEGNVAIGDGTTIADQVIARRGVVIGGGVRIDGLVVLLAGARVGDGATVEMGAKIGRGAIVQPGAVVPAGITVPPATTFP